MDQVLLDDFVDIFLVDVAVPDRFRINDHDRSLGTAVQAAGGVDTHAALSCDAQLFAAVLGIIPQLLRPILLAALTTALALIGTEKNMMFVIGHPDL